MPFFMPLLSFAPFRMSPLFSRCWAACPRGCRGKEGLSYSAKTDASHPAGLLPVQPYLPVPKSPVAAALREDDQQKTYTDSSDFPALEEEGKSWTLLGKRLEISTFAPLCRCWQGTSVGFREDVNKPCQSPLEGLTSWDREGGGGRLPGLRGCAFIFHL